MGIKIYLTEAKITIRLRNVLKSGNWGDQGNSTVIHWIFVLFSNVRFKSQSDEILTGGVWLIIGIISQILSFFTVHVKVHKC